ncbi:hypothetical protein [Gordonia sp. ABSL49_1]|nr:hypothetical protein [Gordonia sp. ABSL49_1]
MTRWPAVWAVSAASRTDSARAIHCEYQRSGRYLPPIACAVE